MRVLVCGGRDYWEWDTMYSVLDKFHKETPITTLIEGGAKGADRIAAYWAKERGIEPLTFEAEWTKYGKPAGRLRNQRMIDEGKPNFVIAFPGGSGTQDMINRTLASKINITIIGDLKINTLETL